MIRRIKWILGLVVILSAVGVLVLKLSGSGDFYVTPSEFKVRQTTGEILRVGGRIEESNISMFGESVAEGVKAEGMKVSFKLSDGKSELRVVYYSGNIPATFRDGQEAVAEGSLNEKGIFVAQKILIKCPNNYLPEKAASVLLKNTKLERLLYR